MKKQDLELAKLKLIEDDLSLVITKKGKVVFSTKKPGINGFLEAIKKLPEELIKASVADKIIGVAAARLCVYSKISSVFAVTISEGAVKTFEKNKISYNFDNKVIKILNRDKSDVCPFEKIAIESETVEDAYKKMKLLADQINGKQKANC
jgi:hypothetical protein